MTRRLAILAATLVLTACSSGSDSKPSGGPTTPPASATSTPAAQQSAGDILAAAAEAATAKGWVHTVATAKQGSKTAKITNDTGPDRGRQRIEYADRRIENLLIANVVYMRANEAALLDFFQFPPEMAKKYADEWLSFTEADPGYGDLAATLDMATLLEDVALTGDLKKGKPTTISGKKVIPITGQQGTGGNGTLFISAEGDPLPVKWEVENTDSTTSVVFSDWGKAVAIKAPSDHTPFTELQG